MRHRLALVAAIVVWVGTIFWPVAFLQAINVQDDIFTSDLLNDRLPARAFLGRSLRQGELPLWVPDIYTGFPALAQVEIGSLYPTNWLLFGALPPYVAIAYAQLLPLVIVGTGTAFLALQWGLPFAAALLAGGAISLSGFFVCHIRQLNLIDAAAWVPWLLLLVERLLAERRARHATALAGVWGLSLLGGHPQISYYAALVLLPYFAVRSIQVARSRGDSRREALADLVGAPTWRFALALAVGGLVAAAALVPGRELASLGLRAGGLSYEMAAAYPVSPLSFWSFFVPYANGDASNASFELTGIFWEQYGYLGLLPMLFAIGAVVVERRDRRVQLLAVMAMLSFLMMIGENGPLFRLAFELVPGMSYFRFPARFLLFLELALALLAAFGFASALRAAEGRATFVVLATIVLGATAADLWFHQRRQVPLADWETWTKPIQTVEILRREAAASDQPWRYFSIDTKRLHVKVFHLSKGWSGDLSQYVAARDLLQPSFNMLFGLESPDGYANLTPSHYERIWGSDKMPGLIGSAGRPRDFGWETPPPVEQLLRLFNVRYVLSAWPLLSSAFERVGASQEGVQVYALRDAMPRAFVVGRARKVDNDDAALRLLASGGLDIANEAIVHDGDVDLPADARSSREVRIVERGGSRLRIETNLEWPGLLVLSEGYFPGWHATVDGVETRILRANMMMRAIPLPAGAHEVVFEFRSASVRLGFLLSAFGLVAWAVCGVAWRRSERAVSA